jgi:hypothetical protein
MFRFAQSSLKATFRAIGISGLMFSFAIGAATFSLPRALGAAPGANTLAVGSIFSTSTTFPEVSNGYLFAYNRTAIPGKTAGVVLMSLSDGATRTIHFSLPDIVRLSIEDVTVTGENLLLVAGSYLAAGGSGHAFVSEVQLDSGNVLTTFDMGNYIPDRICAADDASFWTLGQQPGSANDYDIVHHYASNGTLLQGYIPRGDLPSGNYSFNSPGTAFGMNVFPARLSCSSSGLVGVYLGGVFYEISESGNVQHWQIANAKGTRVAVLSVVSAAAVYVGLVSNSTSAPLRGVYSLQLASSGIATPVATGIPAPSTLVGRDGESILYIVGAQPATSNQMLYWMTP